MMSSKNGATFPDHALNLANPDQYFARTGDQKNAGTSAITAWRHQIPAQSHLGDERPSQPIIGTRLPVRISRDRISFQVKGSKHAATAIAGRRTAQGRGTKGAQRAAEIIAAYPSRIVPAKKPFISQRRSRYDATCGSRMPQYGRKCPALGDEIERQHQEY